MEFVSCVELKRTFADAKSGVFFERYLTNARRKSPIKRFFDALVKNKKVKRFSNYPDYIEQGAVLLVLYRARIFLENLIANDFEPTRLSIESEIEVTNNQISNLIASSPRKNAIEIFSSKLAIDEVIKECGNSSSLLAALSSGHKRRNAEISIVAKTNLRRKESWGSRMVDLDVIYLNLVYRILLNCFKITSGKLIDLVDPIIAQSEIELASILGCTETQHY
jgi:hypothetical protein